MPVEIGEDADAIPTVHVKSWQSAYQRIMPKMLPKELFVGQF